MTPETPLQPATAASIPRKGIKRVIAYLTVFLVILVCGFSAVLSGNIPAWLTSLKSAIFCALTGGVGGVLYCLRGVYLNACVRDNWGEKWLPWYFIRPMVSVIAGCVSYFVLKAGLMVLDTAPQPHANQLGFYVLAFIAGLNVDKFVTKIEDLAQTTWGIEKSRTSKDEKGT